MNKNESISYTEMQKFFAREIKEVGGRPITSKNLELSLLPIHARKTFLRQKCRGIPKLMISIWSSDAHHSGWLRLCIPGIYAFTTFHLDIIYCCILIL